MRVFASVPEVPGKSLFYATFMAFIDLCAKVGLKGESAMKQQIDNDPYIAHSHYEPVSDGDRVEQIIRLGLVGAGDNYITIEKFLSSGRGSLNVKAIVRYRGYLEKGVSIVIQLDTYDLSVQGDQSHVNRLMGMFKQFTWGQPVEDRKL